MDLERERRDPLRVYERPPPKVSYRKRRSTTRDEEEEETGPRDGLRIHQKYDLTKHTLEYITHLPGDTPEDARRMEHAVQLPGRRHRFTGRSRIL
eukprot:1315106-Amphidinium_carterae.1